MIRKAIFPGTFDPFTVGHESLVRRGLQVVDQVVISIGVNDAKKNYFSIDERISMISDLYKKNTNVSICSYDCLTVDFAREIGADFILRGIRSVNDFEYEKTIADMNRKISGIETIVLFTEPELTHVSSTIVRELLRYGHDVTDFVPSNIELGSKR